MKLPIRFPFGRALSVLTGVLVATAAVAQSDVTQPGDPIIASSSNSPGTEGVANAIDNTQAKYLNFDLDADLPASKPVGFVVTPSVGPTRVTGISIQSANDATDRDPKTITLEGSNDPEVTSFDAGNWELIAGITNITAWPDLFPGNDRYQTQIFDFPNFKAYKHYRWTVVETQLPSICCMQVAEVELLGSVLPSDVTQPGDPIVASSSNSPGTEGVANAIDNTQAKYLNFDLDADLPASKPAGFAVTPSIGATVVSGLTIQSANDATDRDPKTVILEGSNDDTLTTFDAGNWTLITGITNITAWPDLFPGADRYQTQTFLFDNFVPYKHYRWTVLETQLPSICCMQVAEVELLGTGAPKDITQPGDPIIASSSNSPGTEGVANAIDNTQAKYLNFDLDADLPASKPAGFVVTPSIGATAVTGLAIQSANDATDRDPKTVILEGSNDLSVTNFDSGNWELVVGITNITAWPDVFPGNDRYQTQTFYFPNSRAYKHYRWTVLETQLPSICCMQVAEVDLLAATQTNPCDQTEFLVAPVDTPVLEGSSATFLTIVNGPWSLQWLVNGAPIPGATATSYTTPPLTTALATNLYAVAIVGCQTSQVVRATIFAPSTNKSIGISFIGNDSNGGPTPMNTNDITGVWTQAFWNNAGATASGTLPDGTVDFVDSDNEVVTTVTFDYATSGAWSAGTGKSSATQRLFNGLTFDTPGGDPATYTFNGVPDGSHSVLAYVVSPPLQRRDINYKITGTTEQTIYIRAMASDEYNAAPGFYRGTSTNANSRAIANYVRFDNVRPANGTITLAVDCLTTGNDPRSGLNAIQLVLNAPPTPPPPAITVAPVSTFVTANGTATLSVTATGEGLTYQWLKDGRNLSNGGNISGANSATLSISDFSGDDQGVYSVAVFNAGGSALSKNAAVNLSTFDIEDSLVAYFKLDETAGSTAANSAPDGVNGSVIGTTSWQAGKITNSLTFDGTSTYVMVTNYTKAQLQIAVSAWVNIPTTAPVDVGQTIIRNALGALSVGGTGAGQFEFGLVPNDAGTVDDPSDDKLQLSAAIAAGPNIVRATAPTAFTLGSWQQVAFAADGAQLHLYVNGAEVASTDNTEDINPPAVDFLSLGAQLSANVDTGEPELNPTTPTLLAGGLDDLGLWTRALSPQEVSEIFTVGSEGKPLTAVILEPPAGGSISISLTPQGQVVITFEGTLQSADTLSGPYTNVEGMSPLTVTPSGAMKFYRAQ